MDWPEEVLEPSNNWPKGVLDWPVWCSKYGHLGARGSRVATGALQSRESRVLRAGGALLIVHSPQVQAALVDSIKSAAAAAFCMRLELSLNAMNTRAAGRSVHICLRRGGICHGDCGDRCV